MVFVAAAGYGKTTAIEARSDGEPELGVGDLGSLGSHSGSLYVASRTPLSEEARALLPGPVFDRGPADLTLSQDQVADVMRQDHGLDDVSRSGRIHALTAGWPALVHFACDATACGAGDDLLAALTEQGTAAADWVRREVLEELPATLLETLCAVAGLDVVTADLAALLSGRGEDAAYLRRIGLLVPHPRHRDGEALRVVPVVDGVVRSIDPAGPAPGFLPRWYEDHGYALPAARVLLSEGRPADACHVVDAHGEALLAKGEAPGVAEVLRWDAPPSTPERQQLLADALRMSGDARGALHVFGPLVAGADATGSWTAALAWRYASVHYMLADYREALAALDRVRPDVDEPGRDDVEVLACRANVLSMLGAEAEAAATAASAVRAATRLGDERAAASAYVAAANTSTGTAKDTNLAQALAAARRAEDVVLTARVLLNQAYGLLGAARYVEAREAAAESVRVAELGAPPGLLSVALHNLGEAERRLGDLEAAELHLRRSVGVCRSHGLARASFGLWGLAEIQRELGHVERGILAFGAAVDAARAADEVQVLVPALAGLARLLALEPTRLGAARVTADEAEQRACPEFAPYAAIASGWVAAADRDPERANERAAAALAGARATGAVDAVAEALELAAAVATDHRAAQTALGEALSIWDAGGARPSADRVRVLLGRLSTADGPARSEAREAARRLVRLGVEVVAGLPLAGPGTAVVEVRVLGGFEVLVGGVPVPLPAWRSKQARTLVKILASRYGRYLSRAELCELLWPDDDPARTGHRLSVVLSAVRSVMDPERVWPADHFVVADLGGLRLDPAHVTVDAAALLQDSSYGVELLRSGDHARAGQILTDVVSHYTGDAFEDDPYEEWADGLREQCRAELQRSLRNLAELRRRSGEDHEAAVLLLRVLTADPYDEHAHRGLVRALVRQGRYGEARRAFDRWAEAMRAIDAPVPDPVLLQPELPAAG